jgi:hypothetical protein
MTFCAIVLIATAKIASACRNDIIVDIDEPIFMTLFILGLGSRTSDSVEKSGFPLSNCLFLFYFVDRCVARRLVEAIVVGAVFERMPSFN